MFNRRAMRQGPMILQPMQDGMIDIDNNSGNIDIDFAQSQDTNVGAPSMSNTMAPIIEPARERVVNRTIEHVVPQV